MTVIGRRGFLGALAGAMAAPMIVRPGLIMPVKAPAVDIAALLQARFEDAMRVMAEGIEQNMFSGVRDAFLPALTVGVYRQTPSWASVSFDKA